MPVAELPQRALHAAVSVVVLTLDYALMLVAMTFNTGIFFAVVLGLTSGIVVFRVAGQRYSERLQVHPPSPSLRSNPGIPALHDCWTPCVSGSYGILSTGGHPRAMCARAMPMVDVAMWR